MNGVCEVNIRLNGKDKVFDGGTVMDLIKEYNCDPRRIAVERNGVIIHREAYGETSVNDGDIIELVKFVGGG
jgi:sulfur carrier protein